MKLKVKLNNRMLPDEELLRDLKAAAKKIKASKISKTEYAMHGLYDPATLIRRFGTWTDAVKKAGLKPYCQNIPAKELLENLETAWKKLGRQPQFSEMAKYSAHSGGPYQRCFGSWNKALLAFDKYIKSGRKVYPREKKKRCRKLTLNKRLRSGKISRTISYKVRYKVLSRDRYMCRFCGASPSDDMRVRLEIDHIIPWSEGGESVPSNLQTLCHKCNSGKSNSRAE